MAGCFSCFPECLECETSPSVCTACDANANRVLGHDSFGRRTCVCETGFREVENGGCVENDCNADPHCSVCESGRNLCLQCLKSRNRVLERPSQICVCEDGFFENSQDDCQLCSQGCSICKNATSCSICVNNAQNNNDGTCTCESGYAFVPATSHSASFCRRCTANCLVC